MQYVILFIVGIILAAIFFPGIVIFCSMVIGFLANIGFKLLILVGILFFLAACRRIQCLLNRYYIESEW